jgi:glycosyltransferase involved in cell wall biosynthesis
MNLLIINRDLPYFPGGGGGCTREYFLNRELAERHDLTIVTNVYNALHKRHVLEMCGDRFHIEYYSPADIDADDGTAVREPQPDARPALKRFLGPLSRFFSPVPSEVNLYQPVLCNLFPIINNVLSEKIYDEMIIVQSDCAGWPRDIAFNGRKILVCHDVKTRFMLSRAKVSRKLIDKLFYFVEALKYDRHESSCAGQFDHIIVVSEEDKEYFGKHVTAGKITVVENGVDCSYFKGDFGEEVENRIVFTGLMNHPPNVDAMLFFCSDIFPEILNAVPESTLYIVGNSPAREVLGLHDDKRIFVTGYVPDIRPFLASASVVVAPVRSGGGTRLKILEAMSFGKAVVSSSFGAAGINYTNGENIEILDDPGLFAKKVVTLLADKGKRKALGIKGRELAQSTYDWKILGKKYCEAIEGLPPPDFKMKVGLNARFMYPGLCGGSEFYLRNLIGHIARIDLYNEYTIFTNETTFYEYHYPFKKNIKKRILYDTYPFPSLIKHISRKVLEKMFRVGNTAVDEKQRKTCRTVKESGSEIIHCFPSYLDPETEFLPAVLSVLDIQHEYFPEFFTEESLKIRSKLYRDSAEKAKTIISISHFTKKTLIEKYGIPGEKIFPVHLGVNPIFYAGQSSENLKDARRKYGLPEDFIIYPAFTWPHKNHIKLFESMLILRRKYLRDTKLVLTGNPRNNQDNIMRFLDDHNLKDRVIFLGFVPTEDLPAIYGNAALMAYPSLFEGFGLPVVEAMAAGCPVACSNTTSLPELVGDAAETFDPTDAEDISDAIYVLMNDPEKRSINIQKAKERAAKFSWYNTAVKTIQVYKETYRLLGRSI